MEKNDKKYYGNLFIERKDLIKEIVKNIEINSEFSTDIYNNKISYNIAICGSYGSGKSYFMNALEEFIKNKEVRGQFNLKDEVKIIRINAWKDDFLNDPILSIGLELNKEIIKDTEGKKQQPDKNILDKLGKFWQKSIKASKIFGKKALPIAGKAILNIFMDKCGKKTSELIKEIGNTIIDDISNIEEQNINENFTNYSTYVEDIKNIIKIYREKILDNKKIYIIVDELDRCRPNYAVEFLEAVNHIFDVYGLVFIFGIDREQLSSSMKVIYGEGLNFDSYFKKFVHYEFDLDKEKTEKILFIHSILSKYAYNKFFNNDEIYNQNLEYITQIIEAFNLCARDIEYACRILSSLEQKNKSYIFLYNLIFVICVKSREKTLYKKLFQSKNDNAYKLIDINIDALKEIFNRYNIFVRNNTRDKNCWNCTILIHGIFFNRDLYYFNGEQIRESVGQIIKNFSDYLNESINPVNKALYNITKIVDNDELKREFQAKIAQQSQNFHTSDKSILRTCYERIY